MTTGLFTAPSLRLNTSNLYEIQDGDSGIVLAQLAEVARVRAPRGSFLSADRVQTPRLTLAVNAPDGTTLLYFDRAEHLNLSPVAPQTAFVATDGRVLARVEFDSHSAFQGGGRTLGTTEQGFTLTPAARLLDANNQPLGDLVYEQPPDLSRPTLPNGLDARTIRWVATDGTVLAQRRDGVLHLDNRVTGVWRPIIICSYLAVVYEFHLPFGERQASETTPELYPGYAGLHSAYDEFQRNFMDQYRPPVRTPLGVGIQRDQIDRLLKIFGPIVGVIAIIILIARFFV
ncbi:hypothetical protein ETD83_19315 [Actinomadura soli]|uniref:Uncharacterized protein n=1 Tax=Actinomadura soli TaxID=2508997 RepID=A0A5C4J9N4_9ACTN|nr:hypothetical protein [Actinomadura soli]TMQ98308.1 hypothetical protein ETD83_19315 [Actinomadura soli]